MFRANALCYLHARQDLILRSLEIPALKELRDDLPDELIVVVERALAREPEARFKSAKEMLRGLTKVLRNVAESTDAYTISQTVLVARRFLGLQAPRTVPPISS